MTPSRTPKSLNDLADRLEAHVANSPAGTDASKLPPDLEAAFIEEFPDALIRGALISLLSPPLRYLLQPIRRHFDLEMAATDLRLRARQLHLGQIKPQGHEGHLKAVRVETPTQQVSIASLTAREQSCLKALLDVGATTQETRRRSEDVASMLDERASDNLVKSTLSRLTKLGFVASKTGRRGGSWLTEDGQKAAVTPRDEKGTTVSETADG